MYWLKINPIRQMIWRKRQWQNRRFRLCDCMYFIPHLISTHENFTMHSGEGRSSLPLTRPHLTISPSLSQHLSHLSDTPSQSFLYLSSDLSLSNINDAASAYNYMWTKISRSSKSVGTWLIFFTVFTEYISY